VPALTFPYKRLGPYFAPVVPIVLGGRAVSIQTEAYVDSGAFSSIFRIELLDALQLRKAEGRPHRFKVGDGDELQGYMFRLPLQLGDRRFRARVAFSDELRIGFNLLGRQTVFDQFEEVAFNEGAGTVTFRWR
jgi:hypothetical protein